MIGFLKSLEQSKETGMSGPLEDKIAVVTGASRGIGRGTAIALAE